MRNPSVTLFLDHKVIELSKNSKNFTNDGKIKTSILRTIGLQIYNEYGKNEKEQIQKIVLAILESKNIYGKIVAFDILNRGKKHFVDLASRPFMFEIIHNHIHDWVSCDDFSTHSFAYWLECNPDSIRDVQQLAFSSNTMVRRAAAVSFIHAAKKGIFVKESLKTVEPILGDDNYLVQKGIGWLLKEHLHFDKNNVIVVDWCLQNRDNISGLTKSYFGFKKHRLMWLANVNGGG